MCTMEFPLEVFCQFVGFFFLWHTNIYLWLSLKKIYLSSLTFANGSFFATKSGLSMWDTFRRKFSEWLNGSLGLLLGTRLGGMGWRNHSDLGKWAPLLALCEPSSVSISPVFFFLPFSCISFQLSLFLSCPSLRWDDAYKVNCSERNSMKHMVVVTIMIKSSKEGIPSFSHCRPPCPCGRSWGRNHSCLWEHRNIMSGGSVSSLTSFPKKREESQTLPEILAKRSSVRCLYSGKGSCLCACAPWTFGSQEKPADPFPEWCFLNASNIKHRTPKKIHDVGLQLSNT